MPIHLAESIPGGLFSVNVYGRLSRQEYKDFASHLNNKAILRREARGVLLNLANFQGWVDGARWEDLELDLEQLTHLERLAVVGKQEWEKGILGVCALLTKAVVHYFFRDELGSAMSWLQSERATVFSKSG